MTKFLIALGASALTLASTVPAGAAQYVYTYTGQNGTTGTLNITTSDTKNPNLLGGGYNITAVSGTFGGKTITGLVNDPVQPLPDLNSSYTYDNVLFPTSTLVFDRYGIAFTVASSTGAKSYNLFNAAADGTPGPTGFAYGLLTSPTSPEQFGKLTLGAVPEPATWGMMILGMGMVGFALRRRIRASEAEFDARIQRIAAGEIA